MIALEIRQSVRTLQAQGHSVREISRLLKLSRNTVRRVLRAAAQPVPTPPCAPQTLARLQAAFEKARGNVARVQQLLADEQDLNVAYSTLTRWVRQAGLRTPPPRAGTAGCSCLRRSAGSIASRASARRVAIAARSLQPARTAQTLRPTLPAGGPVAASASRPP